MPLSPTAAAGLVLPIVLSGEPRGALFEGSCQRPGADSRLSGLPRLGPGPVDPLVVSTGDLLGPDPISGYALEGPPEVERRLLRVLRRAGGEPVFDAVLPGNFELGAAPGVLERLGRSGAVPWLVANARLGAPHRRHQVVVRRGAAIGLTAVVDDQLAVAIDPVRSPPLRSPTKALDESARVLRAAGVELIVALVHVRRSAGLRRVVEILQGLEGPPPDLVLTSALAGDPAYVRLDGLGTSVVAAPRSPREAAVAWLRVDGEGRFDGVEVRREPSPPSPSASADAVRNWVCAQLDVPVRDAPLPPIGRAAFVELVLAEMREAARAEIAVIPDATFGPPPAFPLPQRLTRLDLRRALPFDDGLQVLELSGSRLAEIQHLRTNPQVATSGLGGTQVAGRAIDPLRTYRVVTVDFVADGGDRLIDPATLSFSPLEGAYTLRRLVLAAAERGALDPARGRARPEPGLLDFRVDLGANVKSVSVENPGDAEAPQLTRQDFLGLSGDLRLRLVMDLPAHRIELAERTRFGVVREAPEDGGEAATRENEDVTTVELVYAGRLGGGLERPWIPDAGASARLETELTVPEERGYRRALLQAGVGPSWNLTSNLSVRSQLGFRRELLARADSVDEGEAALAETRVALLSSAELRDEVLAQLGPSPTLLNLRIDHTIDFTGTGRDQVLQGRLGIAVPVFTGLALTAAVDVYLLERESDVGRDTSGAAVDTSFGVRSTTDFSAVFY